MSACLAHVFNDLMKFKFLISVLSYLSSSIHINHSEDWNEIQSRTSFTKPCMHDGPRESALDFSQKNRDWTGLLHPLAVAHWSSHSMSKLSYLNCKIQGLISNPKSCGDNACGNCSMNLNVVLKYKKVFPNRELEQMVSAFLDVQCLTTGPTGPHLVWVSILVS